MRLSVRPGAADDVVCVGWADFAAEQPEFAREARARFGQHDHHVLASLTLTGAPRVSGTEVHWFGTDMWIGSMPGARKSRDLQADPRFAIHVNPGDGSMRDGDFKLSGRVEHVRSGPQFDAFVTDRAPGQPVELFRLLLDRMVRTRLVGDTIEIATWRPGRELQIETRT